MGRRVDSDRSSKPGKNQNNPQWWERAIVHLNRDRERYERNTYNHILPDANNFSEGTREDDQSFLIDTDVINEQSQLPRRSSRILVFRCLCVTLSNSMIMCYIKEM